MRGRTAPASPGKAAMGNETHHILTGTLRRKRAFTYILELPGGGECWLDVRAKDLRYLERFMDRTMTAEGVLADFDLMTLHRFGALN